MTGDDSYHAHCFKCKVCSNRIDELVFAKTSQGIYCMNCHNERMIKIRKHAQKKAERDKANGGSGSSRSRDQEARNYHRDQDVSSHPICPRSIANFVAQRSTDENSRPGMPRSNSNLAASARSDSSRLADNFRSPAKPLQGPYRSDAFDPKPPSYTPTPQKSNSRNPLPVTPSRSPSAPAAPPSEPNEPNQSYHHQGYGGQLNVPLKSNTLPVPPSDPSDAKRRSSYDDGVRPLQILARQDSLGPDSAALPRDNSSFSEGLSAPSRRDKRRSINPGMSLPSFKESPPGQSANLSPQQTTFTAPERNGTLTTNDHGQPVFTKSPSRPPSRSSSPPGPPSATNNLASEAHRTRPSSIPTNAYDSSQDDTIIMTSPPSMTVQLGDDGNVSTTTNSQANNTRHTPTSGQATLSPRNSNGFQPQQRRVSSASNLSAERYIGPTSRSTSPAYRADVPHGIESGTDTEPENDSESPPRQSYDSQPPMPPPKDPSRDSTRSSLTVSENAFDHDYSDLSSQLGDMSDDMADSQAVERMSHSTFIAPALPPIRFSMNAKDFDDLLTSVGNIPPPKPQETQPLKKSEPTPPTPPPSAATPDARFDVSPSGHDIRQTLATNNSGLAGVPEEHDSDDQTASKTQPGSSQDDNRRADRSSDAVPTINVSTTTRRGSSDVAVLLQELRENVNAAKDRGAQQIRIDTDTAASIIQHLEARSNDYKQLKTKLDGMNVSSALNFSLLTKLMCNISGKVNYMSMASP